MSRRHYDLHLEGAHASDLSMAMLRDVCDLLIEGATRAVRLAVEGRSVARGAQPPWLAAAADLRAVEHREGSLQMGVEAQALLDAAPEAFVQQQLFTSVRPENDTALDLLLDAVADAAAGTKDSERLDAGILDVLSKADRLFASGATKLTVVGGARPAVVFDASTVTSARQLADETPAPRVTRVRGLLDSLTVSTRSFVLRVSGTGQTLRGVAAHHAFAELKPLLGSEIVVEGQVVYRPSGNPSRIEIDTAWVPSDADAMWARLPIAEPAQLLPTSGGVALAELYGSWPGEETDDEVFAALEQLS